MDPVERDVGASGELRHDNDPATRPAAPVIEDDGVRNEELGIAGGLKEDSESEALEGVARIDAALAAIAKEVPRS